MTQKRLISLPFQQLLSQEPCFPGSRTGCPEAEYPHCGELLSVPVDGPMDKETHECVVDYAVDWCRGVVHNTLDR